MALPIDVEAGKSYYVWQEVKMGVMVARSALHLVSADVGQSGIRKCDLLQTEGTIASHAAGSERYDHVSR